MTALRGFCRLATVAMCLLMVTMIVVINSLVVTRYAFSYSPSWTEEITRYAMIWLVMLGAGVLTLFDDHIGLNMVVEKLPPRARCLQRLMVHTFVCGIAFLMAWRGFEFAWGLKGVISPALQRSMAIPAFSVPVGATIIVVFSAVRMAIEFAELTGAKPPAIPKQFEFMDNTFKPIENTTDHGAPTATGHLERGA